MRVHAQHSTRRSSRTSCFWTDIFRIAGFSDFNTSWRGIENRTERLLMWTGTSPATGLAINQSDLYVSSSGQGGICRIGPDGKSTLIGTNVAVRSSISDYFAPIAVDMKGVVYFAESFNPTFRGPLFRLDRIGKIEANGSVSTFSKSLRTVWRLTLLVPLSFRRVTLSIALIKTEPGLL